ncbi:hypothetical protein VFPPC_17717 [Pochonia chlamydosporia 170]|uniref:Uncharacterized protein n=1 Tax=Pochonia chlamydosporia 170 TaxID=1380566 RepID=A0A219AQQ7_METCM|nr:hypothetical protein VFPPC_17717 [Pochonia chlamydosporia 170]OWT43107.1 hypothetical protein VFPPC_17717 [Pochonia chlamydosporia 170]
MSECRFYHDAFENVRRISHYSLTPINSLAHFTPGAVEVIWGHSTATKNTSHQEGK